MLPVVIALLTLSLSLVVAQPYNSFNAAVVGRQATNSLLNSCNATCAPFLALNKPCSVKGCKCTDRFMAAQGDCYVCRAKTPGDAAVVQFELDAEMQQCKEDGISLQFKLQLPPAAQAIVDDIGRQSAQLRREQRAFLALQITGGHVGLFVVLVFAVVSHRVRRDPTFLNFCITWIFSSIVYSILLYRGTQGNTILNSLGRVPTGRCLAQAALTNGAQVMTACSTMALVIQLWSGLHIAIRGDLDRGQRQQRLRTIVLLVMPYIFFLAFAIPSVVVGKRHVTFNNVTLDQVLPTNFYCSVIENNSFLQAVYGVTLGLLMITTIFDVLIIITLYKYWRAFRHVQTKSAISLSILLRVLLFSAYRVVVAVAYGTVLNRPPKVLQIGSAPGISISFGVPAWVDLLQATIPLVGFLVLGVNSDILAIMMFWRRNKKQISTLQTINTNGANTIESRFEKGVVNGGTKYEVVQVQVAPNPAS